MNVFGTFTKLRPLSLLRHLSSCAESARVQVENESITWSIYLENGSLVYASHNVEPFDRLERHLRRLSYQVQSLNSEIRTQARLMFETDLSNQSTEHKEYQAICWLVSQGHLNANQAALLLQEILKEVVESFLLIKEGSYELFADNKNIPVIGKLNLDKLLDCSQDRIQEWRLLAPQISSPFQRPYLIINTSNNTQDKLPQIQENLANWMKGFSLRHLAVIMGQDEIQLARNLYPYIFNGSILMHEPDPPFDILPKTFEEHLAQQIYDREVNNQQILDVSTLQNRVTPTTNLIRPTNKVQARDNKPQVAEVARGNRQTPVAEAKAKGNVTTAEPAIKTVKKVYKIVSVDDSPTFLKEISRFLDDENFSVVTISDSVKAVMSIIRHKPDLILLDLNMEGIDGYELCRIIRNNSMFKHTPIVMVTGSKGIVDKVKARLVGASGYLTKPFTRADLLKMVFMHLT
ncbi:MAG: response regulator [Cyanobacteria bacterium P01_A01_bin.84]